MTNDLKPGPIVKYKPEYCQRIIKAASEGAHIPGMMLAINIGSKETWYRWQKEYPEFKEAVEYAKIVGQALQEDILFKGMQGKIPGYNATAHALILNNKYPEEYKRNGSSAEVNITNNTLNLTGDQLKQRILETQEKLKLLGDNTNIIDIITDE